METRDDKLAVGQQGRASFLRGISFPLETSPSHSNRFRRPTRPRSAELGSLVIKSAPELPCFRKTLADSPLRPEAPPGFTEFLRTPSLDVTKGEHSPGFLKRIFTFHRGLSKDETSIGEDGNILDENLTSRVSSSCVTRQSADCSNRRDYRKTSTTDSGDKASLEQEVCVKVRRYHSLSPLRHGPATSRSLTPPLAVFSSNEDISSVPQTPKKSVTMQPSLTQSPLIVMSQLPENLDIQKTISPELEEEICKRLLEPPKYVRVVGSEDSSYDPQSGSPSRHSIVLEPVQRAASLENDPSNACIPHICGFHHTNSESTLRVPSPVVAHDKLTATSTSVQYRSRRSKLKYKRRKHYTIEVGGLERRRYDVYHHDKTTDKCLKNESCVDDATKKESQSQVSKATTNVRTLKRPVLQRSDAVCSDDYTSDRPGDTQLSMATCPHQEPANVEMKKTDTARDSKKVSLVQNILAKICELVQMIG